MTRSKKKAQVYELMVQFINSTDAGTARNLRSDILKEIALCGYNAKTSPELARGLKIWGTHLRAYTTAIKNKNVTAELKKFTNLGLAGLLNFVDLSTLPS